MLLFSDSFDLYNTLSQKYDSVFSATISSTNPRTGAQSMKTTGNGQWAQKNISLNQTVIAGVAVAVTAGANDHAIFEFYDGGTAQVSILCDAAGHMRAYRGTVVGAILLGTSTAALSFGTYNYIEAQVKIDPSIGTVDIHVNGVSFLSLSGINTRASGASQIGSVSVGAREGGIGLTIYWDDFYICDNSGSYNNAILGPLVVLASLPTGNGTLDQFTIGGSVPAATNYQSVNEKPPDDGVTFVYDGTVGDIDRYTFPTIASSFPTLVVGSILAVVVNLRAELDTPGTRSIRAATLSGGVAGTSASDLALTTAWADYEGVLETDPNTSAPWTEAAVDAAEFGQKVTV